METSEFLNDFITINGKEIPVKVGYLEQEKLKFYPENPRIYSIIYAGEKTPNQEEIEERLSSKEYVNVLVQSIKANGGLTDPLIVRDKDFVVLEGNSRLAAYRILAKKDPIKWGKAKCKILPGNISDDVVFTLLGEYHIIGRTDWQPYEQAGYLYRRHNLQNVSLDIIQNELGLKKNEISHLIEVYSFMVEYKDTDINRWSYYEEYLKSNHIKKVREEIKNFDEIIVEKIKSGEITKAVDIREKLVPIAKSSAKIVKQFVFGKTDFEETYTRALAGGAGNVVFEKLHRFREWLANATIEDDILDNDNQVLQKCIFELTKIQKRVTDVLKRVKK